MKIIVLLSAGLHPVSGRPCPVPLELQAIGLANRLLAEQTNSDGAARLTGLHAGAAAPSLADCLGHGLSEILLVEHGHGDPAAALADAIAEAAPDLVLAGRRGRGGEDSGLLPYRLAASLGWPICADAMALAPHASGLAVTQALPRGARRRVVLRLPCIVTVHPSAPPAPAFAFAAARRGRITQVQANNPPPTEGIAASEHPYRKRPRLVRGANFSGTAQDRLRAATEISGGGQVLLDPSPEEAATAIIALLKRLGLAKQNLH